MYASSVLTVRRWYSREFLGRRVSSHQPYTTASTDVSQMALRSWWICISWSFEKKWSQTSTAFPVWSYWYVHSSSFFGFRIGTSNFERLIFVSSYISYHSKNSLCTQKSSRTFDLYWQITGSWTWWSASKSTWYYGSWNRQPTSSTKSQWQHSCTARISRSHRDRCERERSICAGPKLGRVNAVY